MKLVPGSRHVSADVAESSPSIREAYARGLEGGGDDNCSASGFHAPSVASVVLLYNCGLIWASVIYMMGGASYFTYAHIVFFGSAAVLLLAGKNGLEGLLRPLVSRWSALFLGAFLVYYLIAALVYPVPEISADHMRSLVVRVLPGLLMGYVTFAAISSRFVIDAKNLNIISRSRYYVDIIVVMTYVVTIVLVFVIFGQKLRSDYFLIHIAPERSMYQFFGVYLTSAFISALVLVDSYGVYFAPRSFVMSAFWMLLVASFALASFFLCQMVGSNTGSALMVAIGIGSGLYMLVRAWFGRSRNGGLQVAAMLAAGLIALAIFFVVVANVQPLRIFGFKHVDVLSAVQRSMPKEAAPSLEAPFSMETPPSMEAPSSGVSTESLPITDSSDFEIEVAASSVSSRMEIFSSIGLRQLAHAPLWGDLGVEHIVATPGNYIHSLVSVQSHLGVVGSILLFGFLIERLWTLYTRRGNAVLKVSAVPILMMAIIGMFFTWTPLWFIVGGLYSLQGNGETN